MVNEAKILVLGCPGVGKSSLIAQLVAGDAEKILPGQPTTTFPFGSTNASLKFLDIAGEPCP